MKKSAVSARILAIGMVVAVAAIGLASVAHAAKPDHKKLKANEITCEEFLGLGTEVQPRVVYWLDGFTNSSRTEDAEIDVEELERPVEVIVTECHKAPKESLLDKVKAYF